MSATTFIWSNLASFSEIEAVRDSYSMQSHRALLWRMSNPVVLHK